MDAYRDTGLAINAANLSRLSVTDSIVPRTLQAFRLLDLLDEDGNATQALLDFKQAPSDTYRERLAETLRAAYAPIFEVTGGLPRRINRLCDLSLLIGYADGLDKITPEEIESVAEELVTMIPD